MLPRPATNRWSSRGGLIRRRRARSAAPSPSARNPAQGGAGAGPGSRRGTGGSTSGSSGIRNGILRRRSLESAHMLRHVLPLLLLLGLFPGCAQLGEKPQPDGLRSTLWGENRIAWENRGGGAE